MTPEEVLPDALLERIRSRAAGYDRDNAFFHEDLADLAAAGYLKIFVPAPDGGLGLGLAAAAQLQRRLATAAPATALAINMHLVWTGVAHVLAARGDASLDFVLREAAEGEIFAFGNSEAGNDSVLFDSLTVAAPQPDGELPVHRPKDLHQPFPRLDPARDFRQGRIGQGRGGGAGSRLHHPADARATRSWRTGTPWACGPASPTPPSWTAPCPGRTGSSASCRWARTPTR